MDIYDDAPIIAYLQVSKVPIRLTPKKRDHVVNRAKRFKWEGNSFLWMWADGQVKVVLHPEQCENLVRNVHGSWAILGSINIQFALDIVLVARDLITSSTIYF